MPEASGRNRFVHGLMLAVWLLAGCESAPQAKPPSASPTPDALRSFLKAPADITFCGESVPLATPDVQERFEKEMLLSVWNQPQVILWLKRAARFMPHIESVLRQSKLPARPGLRAWPGGRVLEPA